jgi:streptomycin 6-kinase
LKGWHKHGGSALSSAWKITALRLIADTVTSWVYRVRLEDRETAIVKRLKPAGLENELRGADFLRWRDGSGCVQLLARQGSDMLLEDAGEKSLLDEMNLAGDQAAMEIMAQTLPAIHAAASSKIPRALQPLEDRFVSLFEKAKTDPNAGRKSLFLEAARTAKTLLGNQHEVRPLHGDLHHENVFFGARGWLAIDPKGLVGDTAFDVANLFYNPLDRDDLRTNPERIGSLAEVFAKALGRDERTMLEYGFAHAALSSSWHVEDGNHTEAERSLAVASAIRAVAKRGKTG